MDNFTCRDERVPGDRQPRSGPRLYRYLEWKAQERAVETIADAVETLVNRPEFKLNVYPGAGEHFEVGSEDQATLTAFLLRRARQRAGLSLAQVARRLGATSINAYARYEQGRSVPTIRKLSQLFAAVTPHRDLVLGESEA